MNGAFFAVAVSWCVVALSTLALAQGDPAAVARRYVEAVNGGNVTTIVTLFTDDATVAHGRVCTPPCVGDPAAVRRQYEQDVANGVKLTIVDLQVSGNTVALRMELFATAMRAAHVERIIGTDTIEVRGEKIASLRFAPDLNDPQTAKFREWTRTQTQPPRQ
jgi:ketosteroid isomerase-like protein